ncbi:MAG: EAL domain-containing protein [Hyphomonadaceae bacterium]|nr:EAL domain-containing protein [Hyphomonadaceae bacterium]
MTSEARDALFRDIERAIVTDEFEPAFQPVARLSDGALAGFEALARWRRAPETLDGPSAFFEEAMARGVMGEISRRILLAACATMRGWRKDGIDGVFISANVLGHDLEREDFVSETLGIVHAAELPPGVLKLEVTEQQILRDPPRIAAALAQLRAAGVKILFDDFGSGFSSFTWLTRLPADALKFDHHLISGITEDGPHLKIVRAMVALAHELGLETIAEGVETEAQREVLADIGCDFAQGHLFAKPLAAVEARALIGKLKAA